MNLFKSSIILYVFISIIFLGCSEESKAPIQPNANTKPSLMKTSGSGAWIVKNSAHTLLLFYDKNEGLALALGVNDVSEFCSGKGGLDEVDIKEILLPDSDPDLRREIAKIKDIVYARIWKVDSKPPNDLCYFFNSVPSTASGFVNLRIINNDVLADLQDNINSVSWGYKANGTLQGENSEIYKLNLVERNVSHDGYSTIKSTLHIKLTPFGK